jgi:hypothetical protein
MTDANFSTEGMSQEELHRIVKWLGDGWKVFRSRLHGSDDWVWVHSNNPASPADLILAITMRCVALGYYIRLDNSNHTSWSVYVDRFDAAPASDVTRDSLLAAAMQVALEVMA